MKKRGRPKKITFEEKYETVLECVEKRRGKWFLNAVNWIDWEDVKIIIITHINRKWNLWDQKRALKPWLNRIISNQIKNLLRNYYGNFIKPCVRCPFNVSGAQDNIHNDNQCSWTKSGNQDKTCPLFKKWLKGKKSSFDINLATSINEKEERIKCDHEAFNIDVAAEKLHEQMKIHLNEKHYNVYKMLYIDHMSHEEIAKKLGYISNEKGRIAGYKQIRNSEKYFKEVAKKIISKKDIL